MLAAERAAEHFVYGGSLQSEHTVTAWVDLVLQGTLRPTMRSAPPPLHALGPLHTIVASTFEPLVLDGDRDTLLLVTAPWCEACAELERTFQRVADVWAPHPKKIRVATFDAGSNDLPRVLDLAKLPTILLFTSHAAAVQHAGKAARPADDEANEAPTSAVDLSPRVPLDLSELRTEAELSDAIVQYSSLPRLERPLETGRLQEMLGHLPLFQQQAQALLSENTRLRAELAEARRQMAPKEEL